MLESATGFNCFRKSLRLVMFTYRHGLRRGPKGSRELPHHRSQGSWFHTGAPDRRYGSIGRGVAVHGPRGRNGTKPKMFDDSFRFQSAPIFYISKYGKYGL